MSVPSPALDRLTESNARILGHLGGIVQLREVAPTKDALRGSETWAPTGETVEASAHRFEIWRRVKGGERERVDRIAVERGPFESRGGLSERWQVLLDGAWCPIEAPVLSDDRTAWEADLCPPLGEGA